MLPHNRHFIIKNLENFITNNDGRWMTSNDIYNELSTEQFIGKNSKKISKKFRLSSPKSVSNILKRYHMRTIEETPRMYLCDANVILAYRKKKATKWIHQIKMAIKC